MSLLYLPFDRGVLWYYWAVQLRSIMLYFSTNDTPHWSENGIRRSKSTCSLIHILRHRKKLQNKQKNPIVKHMIWYDVKKYLKEPKSLSLYSPIWGYQFFIRARSDATFQLWNSKGLKTIKDIYLTESGVMTSFDELRSKFNLDRKHFLKYQQLRSFVKVNQDIALTRPLHADLAKNKTKDSLKKGIISEYHKLMISYSPESSQYKLNAWGGIFASFRSRSDCSLCWCSH